jgi:type I restriction enzyme S subunit
MSEKVWSLAEVCFPPQYGAIATTKEEPEGPLFIRQTDIKAGRIEWDSVPYCDLQQSEINKYSVQNGDILVSRLGSIGHAAIVRGEHNAVFAGYLVRFKVNPDLAHPSFIAYHLQSKQWFDHVRNFGSGAVQPTLNANQMGEYQFRLPTYERQLQIANALESFDEKIESNYRQIRTIEQLGHALTSKALGVALHESPIFNGVLEDILAILETGKRPNGGATSSGRVSIGAESIQSAGILKSRKFKYVPENFAQEMKRGILEPRDVLLYKDGGTPGNFIPHVSAFGNGFPTQEAVINEHVYRLRVREPLTQGLLYWVLGSAWMIEEMKMRGTGAAIPGLNSSNVRELPIPDLKTKQIIELSPLLDSMLELMLQLGAETLNLEASRDSLLAKFLNT